VNYSQNEKRRFVIFTNIAFSVFLLLCIYFVISKINLAYKISNISNDLIEHQDALSKVKGQIQTKFNEGSAWPYSVSHGEKSFQVEYTFNDKLTKYIKRLLKRFNSDYTSVVVIDNKTGEILSAIGKKRGVSRFDQHLPFSNTHPAASLIKIVTSAELLQNANIHPETKFTFRGKSTTLYKYQLRDKSSIYNRHLSFKKAFALSNNVVFGKAAINNTTPMGIKSMAENFGFNENIMADIKIRPSIFGTPENQYNLAEMASGFNKKTLMSTVHGAVLSSIVANNGNLVKPHVIKEIKPVAGGSSWEPGRKLEKRISQDTSLKLSELMKTTVIRGTAKSAFRRFSSFLKKRLVIGGKTGTLKGGEPYGQRDWFTAFAVPVKEEFGKGISVCVMNVNINKWYVKSSFLTRKIIEFYFREVGPITESVSKVDAGKQPKLKLKKL
jgi:penicillin-binding protein A